MRVVPETSNRADWPRLVAQSVNDSQNKVAALEKGVITRAKLRFLCG